MILLIITDGRRDLLERTLESAKQNLPEFENKIIINDCQDPLFKSFLNSLYDYEVYHNHEKLGFAGAIQKGWDALSPTDYVFHLEEDFTFNEKVDIDKMKEILQDDKICQVSLKRQKWGAEIDGFIEDNPQDYEQMDGYVRHRNFFTTNPSLYKYDLTKIGFPQVKRSEHEFSQKLFNLGFYSAILGGKFDPPKVTHTGVNQSVNAKGY